MTRLPEIRSLIARHTAGSRISTPMPGIRLSRAITPNELFTRHYQPSFVLVAGGKKRTLLGDRIFDYSAGNYLVISVDLVVESHIVEASEDAPYLAFAMSLRPDAIASLLLEHAPTSNVTYEPLGLSVSDASDGLQDAIVRMLQLLDEPSNAAVFMPLIEREILWRLITGEQGGTVRQIGLADSRLSQIAHVIQWLRANYTDSFVIEDLARMAGMGASTFHRHFKAVTNMSPLQYQKQMRLHMARTQLLSSAGNVSLVGFQVGYDNPSQFSREYSRAFGTSPKKDAARLRTSAPLETDV